MLPHKGSFVFMEKKSSQFLCQDIQNNEKSPEKLFKKVCLCVCVWLNFKKFKLLYLRNHLKQTRSFHWYHFRWNQLIDLDFMTVWIFR